MLVYDVIVKTGSDRGAGTDANVFITLYGERGCTTKRKLNSRKNDFERDQRDSFVLEVCLCTTSWCLW